MFKVKLKLQCPYIQLHYYLDRQFERSKAKQVSGGPKSMGKDKGKDGRGGK